MTIRKVKITAVAALFAALALPASTASAFTSTTTCTQTGPFINCSGTGRSGEQYRSRGIRTPHQYQNTETWRHRGRQLRLETNCLGGFCTQRLR